MMFAPTQTIFPFQCHCTWTICCCMPGNMPYRGTSFGGYYEIETFPKAHPNKLQMDGLRLKACRRAPERVRIVAPSVRPSIQALSMRIR